MIDVVLVAESNLFRQGLRRLLDPSEFSVTGEARDLTTLGRLLHEGFAPDLVVAVLNGCPEAAVESLRELRATHSDLRIVVLADELSLSEMAHLLRAGADGYLLNELSAEAFSLSLLLVMKGELLVMKGEKVLPSTLASMLANECTAGNALLIKTERNLTKREKQVLRCLLNTYSNKDIAGALNISEGTVKVHLKNLMKKISVGNRAQAALWARNNGIDSGQIMAVVATSA